METRVTYKIVIPDEERRKFKDLAKSRGMTIQGYLALLIKRELRESEASSKDADYSSGVNATPYGSAGDIRDRLI